MGKPAARITDMHTCPMVTGTVPHVGGPVASGKGTVLIGGLPAARVSDKATCVGPIDFIVKGSATILIGGLPAARPGDTTAHGGVITTGCPTVLLGEKSSGATLGFPVEAAAIFPGQQNHNNCGVQSSQQLVRQATKVNVSETRMLNRAVAQGWASAATSPANPAGGTGPDGRQKILADRGVSSHLEQQTMQNIVQNVSEGKGVITSHDAGILWGDNDYNGSGHAVVVTGVKYDAAGKLESVIINDTGQGQSALAVPAAQFEQSLRPNRQINVTDKAIWP